jgi:hypothetical protein
MRTLIPACVSVVAVIAACGGSSDSTCATCGEGGAGATAASSGSGARTSTSSGSAVTGTGAGASSTTTSTSTTATTSTTSVTSTTSTTTTGAGGGASGPLDLCAGLVQDKLPHAMTPLAKPAVGQTVIDAEFGTTIRRITAVAPSGGGDAAIIPLYSTISAWNADESLLMLYDVNRGQVLYDGKTYAFIATLDIAPADIEQVYWDTSDPDLFYYVDSPQFIRYHVSTGAKDRLHDFSGLCGGAGVTGGDDPMFTSWDSHRLGLVCGAHMFIYDQSTDTVLGPVATPANGTPPAQVAPSGALAYLEAGSGQVLDDSLTLVRSLGLQVPDNHASLGRLANGHDTWNGAVYDDGNDDAHSNVGILVTWDMTDASGGAVIGPKTGYPYPPDGHVSALAYKQPGWVFVSTIQDHSGGAVQGAGLLDDENLVADTNTGVVCRIGRHRSFGKDNTHLQTSYWAEPHTTPSPSGTRAVFASDWGDGATVDSYVVELPSYVP